MGIKKQEILDENTFQKINFLNIAFILMYFLTFGLFVYINCLRAFHVAKILQMTLVIYKYYKIFLRI